MVRALQFYCTLSLKARPLVKGLEEVHSFHGLRIELLLALIMHRALSLIHNYCISPGMVCVPPEGIHSDLSQLFKESGHAFSMRQDYKNLISARISISARYDGPVLSIKSLCVFNY